MKITTRISSTQCDGAGHHPECEREHVPNMIRFTSATPNKGFYQTEAMDCMLYEMEDAADRSIIGAIQNSADGFYISFDDDAVREAAAEVASRADGLLTGGKAHVRHTVAAA